MYKKIYEILLYQSMLHRKEAYMSIRNQNPQRYKKWRYFLELYHKTEHNDYTKGVNL